MKFERENRISLGRYTFPNSSTDGSKVKEMIDDGLLQRNERQVPAIYNRGTLRRTKSPHYADKSNVQSTGP